MLSANELRALFLYTGIIVFSHILKIYNRGLLWINCLKNSAKNMMIMK
jgi:hypothetical protein